MLMPMSLPTPRENPDLIGQEPAEGALLSAWRSERLAHAWLIGGPRGVGKATLAFRFARFLLASGAANPGERLASAGDSLAMTPDHPIFRRVAAGGHSDLLTVERRPVEGEGGARGEGRKLRSEIVAADVRAVGDFLHLTPAEGRWRVVIVDAAEDLNAHAANALLKVLEEPPPQAVLLLVSHAPGRLLATIRSRCRRLILPTLAPEALAALIARLCPEATPEERERLGELAEGSIGRAAELWAGGGVALDLAIAQLLDRLPRLDLTAVHALADQVARKTEDGAFRLAMALIADWTRAAARAASVDQPAPGNPGRSGLDRWLGLWEKIARLGARAESANLDRKQVLVDAFLAIEAAANGRELAIEI